MALSNLIVEKLEKFGGIDLKKNYRKFFGNALAISIGLHLLAILFYLGYTVLQDDEGKHIPHLRVRSVAELAPPPSTQNDPPPPAAVAPPPDMAQVKPNLGVPVPVPDMLAPTPTMPNMNEPPPPQAPTGPIGNGPATLEPSNAPVLSNIKDEPEPGIDDFIDVTEEPAPIKPIESLVEYPETAKRSGLEGKVIVAALIGKDGAVEKVVVQKADYDIFKQAAIDAMMKARFTPARQNGTPVRVWLSKTITFKLVNK
jgi:protein TonB